MVVGGVVGGGGRGEVGVGGTRAVAREVEVGHVRRVSGADDGCTIMGGKEIL